jgi:acyl carrier protein/NADP-dependent 3-hydroxy acid dehydrogenase YdfG
MLQFWDQKIKLFYLYQGSETRPPLETEALSGLLRSAMLENPNHSWRVVAYYEEDSAQSKYQRLLQEWLANPATTAKTEFVEVHYRNSQRLLRSFDEVAIASANNYGFKHRGVYLMAGGLGPVGELLCRKLCADFDTHLIILSRSKLDENKRQQCKRLETLGGKVDYFSVDVTNLSEMEAIYSEIKQQVGAINGVIHLARLVEDGLILSKSWQSFNRSIQAKINGTLILDHLTAQEPLDFFMLFSSMAAYGIRGSSDYGYASAFQNVFAKYRNRLCTASERHGFTVSQCWGPWVVDTYLPDGRDEKMAAAGLALIDLDGAFDYIAASLSCQHSILGMMKVENKQLVKKQLGLAARDTTASTSQDDTGDNKVVNAHKPAGLIETSLQRWEQQVRHGSSLRPSQISDVMSFDEIKKLPPELIDRLYKLIPDRPIPTDRSAEPISVKQTIGKDIVKESGDSSRSESLKTQVRSIIIDLFEIDDVDDEQTFQNYGMDSVSAVRMATRLEATLHLEIKPQWLIEYPSVASLSKLLYRLIPAVNSVELSVSPSAKKAEQSAVQQTLEKQVGESSPTIAMPTNASSSSLKIQVREILTDLFKIKNVDDEQTFQNYGMDSVSAVRMATRLEATLSMEIKPQWFIDYPSVASLSEHLTRESGSNSVGQSMASSQNLQVRSATTIN